MTKQEHLDAYRATITELAALVKSACDDGVNAMIANMPRIEHLNNLATFHLKAGNAS